VFGGKLTALRWPEKELVDVPAAKVYVKPVRPLGGPGDGLSVKHADDEMLDLSLVTGKRIVELGTGRPITIEEGSAAAALEVMTRFAIDPKWLIYLPPTMSPPATTARDGLLEHPDEAFACYRDEGVGAVVVEEKHMGSRALIVLCPEAAARDRFGVTTGETGAVYTRTGRAFFQERSTTEAVLARVRAAVTEVGFWEQHSTGGVEGMVVKPRDFIVHGRKGLVQPAVTCRGSEYLRIIYGPEYDAREHLARQCSRGLGRKRSLAMREFLLGQEALRRFIAREPLRRVHEAVFAVLALESELVDPRL
jgi:hypothetical protein